MFVLIGEQIRFLFLEREHSSNVMTWSNGKKNRRLDSFIMRKWMQQQNFLIGTSQSAVEWSCPYLGTSKKLRICCVSDSHNGCRSSSLAGLTGSIKDGTLLVICDSRISFDDISSKPRTRRFPGVEFSSGAVKTPHVDPQRRPMESKKILWNRCGSSFDGTITSRVDQSDMDPQQTSWFPGRCCWARRLAGVDVNAFLMQ